MKYIVALPLLFALFGCGTHSDSGTSERSAYPHRDMGHSSHDHSAMKSSPGAADASLELQFIDTMTVHHQGAVEMAKLARGRTENRQIEIFAEGIIDAQEREIAEMSRWRAKWFGEKPAAVNMAFPGMSEGMQGMNLSKLENLKGREFDLEFIRQMIPHHEGALKMAEAVRSTDSYAELKKMAETVIKDQTSEIEWMKKKQLEFEDQ